MDPLTEALTKAHQSARILTADIVDAHRATTAHRTPAERAACSYLLRLIEESRILMDKLSAIK